MENFKIDNNDQLYIPNVLDTEIILYSTGCPKCKVLETKLQNKGIYYTKNSSISDMTDLGISAVPVLRIGDVYFSFSEAIKWLNDIKGE